MDLLRQPLIASFLASRRARMCVQLSVLAAAVVIVLHGLFGPQIGPRNLATVVTSIHWRGLLIVGLVLAANLFCFSCPMMLTRDAARRVITPRLRWPRFLRGRWLALGLLAFTFFAYELWDLWDRPQATAWVILGYFGVALAVDLTFKGASFCKYVCPVGQFNFTASTLSPTEVQIRSADTCRTCRTFECIRGSGIGERGSGFGERGSGIGERGSGARGCELGLFLPAKVGNLNCTMCFDCVRACPHDNIGLVTRMPGTEWLASRRRSGIGRITDRPDLAVVSLVFTSAALFTAFAMTTPGVAVEQWLGRATGMTNETALFAVLFLAAVLLVPLALVTLIGRLTRTTHGTLRTAIPFVHAMVPLGVGVWLAHYGFHLLTGALTIVPVTQSAAIDAAGVAMLGEPMWGWVGLKSGTVLPLQVGVVLLAAAGSLGLIAATASRELPERPTRAAIPWLVVVALVSVVAIWIFMQPMDMRGIGPG
jgi:polyferredoxin